MADRTNGEITIEADKAKIMNVIADLPLYPQWSEGVESVEVLDETPDGRPDRARFKFSSGPIKDTYILKYSWHGDDSVDWTLEEGGVIKQQDGTYTLTDDGNGSVTVAYDLLVELSVPMIGMIRKKAEKMIVKTALQGLKARVDSL